MPRGAKNPGSDDSCPRRIRRFIEPALLLLLNQEPLHGYALMDGLRHLGMADYPIDKSAIYRALRSLEGRGVVESDWDMEVTSGPPRRVYTLTSEGHVYLNQWVGDLRATVRMLVTFIDVYDGVAAGSASSPIDQPSYTLGDRASVAGQNTQESIPMRIVVSAEGAGLEAKASGIFGRCPQYVYVDTDTMAVESEMNPAANMAGGAGIQAAQHVIARGVGAVLSANVGPNAIEVFDAAGVDVYMVSAPTVREAVEAFLSGALTKQGEAGLVSHAAPATAEDARQREIGELAREAVALRRRLAEILTRIEQLEKEG